MIILRIFFYLICIISIGWSLLVFGGPPIIKRLISGYSEGALKPTGITVSPTLDIGISRLEFKFQNEMAGWRIEGFSRATEIAWSLFGDKPFLEINLGPSVLKDNGTAESVSLYTPSIQKIDWQNIPLVANLNGLALNYPTKMHSVALEGHLNLESSKVSNVSIAVENFSAAETDGSSGYSASLIRSVLSEMYFNVPLNEQAFSSTFVIEDVVVSQPNLTAPEAIMEILVTEDARILRIDVNDLKILEFGGFIETLKIDGRFSQLNVLQELFIATVDSVPFKNSPKFPEMSASVNRTGDRQYKVNIEGDLDEYELSSSDNFIGSLPRANFVIDLELGRSFSELTSTSKINFTTLNEANIFGTVDLGLSSEFLKNLGCRSSECELSDFALGYEISIDDEWVMGSAECPKSSCAFLDIEHYVRTSNTVNIFAILNQEKILNPLSSLYLFGVISSGQKIDLGHELKFQF